MYLLCLVGVILLCLIPYFYVYMVSKYNYWHERKIKGPKPIPIVGNFGRLILGKESLNQMMIRLYQEFPEEKVVGLYRGFQPVLLIRDPVLLKDLFIKDFTNFQDRGVRPNDNRFNDNLLVAQGETWRILRTKLTPIFTSGKIKAMIPLIKECTDDLINYVNKLIENNIDHEIRSLTGKYTLAVIGSCVFGIKLDAFSDIENEFSQIVKPLLRPSFKVRFWQTLDMIIPGIRKVFSKMSQTTTHVENFFVKLVNDIEKQRTDKEITRNDFMNLMIELKKQGKANRRQEDGIHEIEIDDLLIAAQAFIFYIAGLETSSAAMSFLLYELALHQEMQDKIFKEINKICDKHSGELCLEGLSDMHYLDMVLSETLRKHTVAGILVRKSLESYTFPETNIKVDKGMPIFISASALHGDPNYFPNPDEFCPERFSTENIKNIQHCTYLPFGEGPRNCIGMRFAKVESMMGLAAFLKNFKVAPSAKTKPQLEYSARTITLTSKDGIWLKISKR